MTLYSGDACPQSHRVRIVLAEKNITHEIHSVDPDRPTEDFMEMNPYGVVPTLVDRDLVIYDARIIMEYLDERFPHPPLMPVDPVSRAKSRLLMHRINTDWYDKIADLESRSEKKANKARNEIREGLTVISPMFEQKPFFMSDDFSLVDCSIAPFLWRLDFYGIKMPPRAKGLTTYMENVFSRDSFLTSLTEREREMHE